MRITTQPTLITLTLMMTLCACSAEEADPGAAQEPSTMDKNLVEAEPPEQPSALAFKFLVDESNYIEHDATHQVIEICDFTDARGKFAFAKALAHKDFKHNCDSPEYSGSYTEIEVELTDVFPSRANVSSNDTLVSLGFSTGAGVGPRSVGEYALVQYRETGGSTILLRAWPVELIYDASMLPIEHQSNIELSYGPSVPTDVDAFQAALEAVFNDEQTCERRGLPKLLSDEEFHERVFGINEDRCQPPQPPQQDDDEVLPGDDNYNGM